MQALLIDGLNLYIGDVNSLPEFATTRQKAGELVGQYDLSASIDPLGGIGKTDDLTFKVIDTGNLNTIVSNFRLDVFNYDAKAIGNTSDLGVIFVNDTVIRVDDPSAFTVGDYVYSPTDTWLVTAVDTTNSNITVLRSQFSTLEDPVRKDMYKSDLLDYVCLLGINRPLTTFGKWVTLYENGELVYIGIINGVTQRGKYWELKTKSITSLIADFKNPGKQYTIKGDDDIEYVWYILSEAAVTVSYDGGLGQFVLPKRLGDPGTALAYWVNEAVWATMDRTHFGFNSFGFVSDKYFYLDSPRIEWLKAFDVAPRQRHDVKGDNNEATSMEGGVLPRAAYLFGLGDWFYLDLSGGNYVYLRGKTLQLGEFYIELDSSGYISAIYDKELKPVSHGAAYQNEPIKITEKSIYRGTLTGVIKDFLTDAKSGLGLPESLIDIPEGEPDTVVVDFSDGVQSDYLKAFGLAITWSDGKVKVKTITPPEQANTQVDIGKVPINWGKWAPISKMSIVNFENEYNQIVEYSHLPAGVSRQDIKYDVKAHFEFDLLSRWSSVALRQMKWLSQYLPSVQVTLPDVELELGDAVNIKTELGAQTGYYGFSNMPGLVVGKKRYNYTIVLNPSATYQKVYWAPSALLLSQSGNDVTVDRVWNGVKAGSHVDFYSTPEYNIPGTQYKIARVNGDTIALENTAYTYSTNNYGYVLTNDWAQDILTLSRSSIWHIRVYIDSLPAYAYGRIIGILGAWASGSWNRLIYLIYNDTLKRVYWYYMDPTGTMATTSGTAYAPVVNDQWMDIVALYNRGTGTFGVWSDLGSGMVSGLGLYDGYVTAKIAAFNQQPAYSAGFTGRLSHVMFYNGIGITDIDEAAELVLSQSLDSQLFIKYDFGKSLNPVDEVSGHDMGGATYLYLTQNNLPLDNYPHFTVPTYADTNQDPEWQARYAFAADTNNQFSNGDPGKEYV